MSVALVLLLMLGISNCSAAGSIRQLQHGRKMLQATPAEADAVVNSSEPQVQATSGPVSDKLKSLASMVAAAKASKYGTSAPAPAPAVGSTIVVPAPQTAAVPTTIGGPLSLSTSTPVKVFSPVNVTTPVQQKSVQLGHHPSIDPIAVANTLINGANLLANVAGAAGSITGAVPGYIGLGTGLNLRLPLLPPLTDVLNTPLGDTSLGGILGSLADLIPSAGRSGLVSKTAQPLAVGTGTASSSASSSQKVAGLVSSAQGSEKPLAPSTQP